MENASRSNKGRARLDGQAGRGLCFCLYSVRVADRPSIPLGDWGMYRASNNPLGQPDHTKTLFRASLKKRKILKRVFSTCGEAVIRYPTTLANFLVCEAQEPGHVVELRFRHPLELATLVPPVCGAANSDQVCNLHIVW